MIIRVMTIILMILIMIIITITCPRILSIFELLLKSVVLFALLRAPLAHLVLLLVTIIIIMMIIVIIGYDDHDYKMMMVL